MKIVVPIDWVFECQISQRQRYGRGGCFRKSSSEDPGTQQNCFEMEIEPCGKSSELELDLELCAGTNTHTISDTVTHTVADTTHCIPLIGFDRRNIRLSPERG